MAASGSRNKTLTVLVVVLFVGATVQAVRTRCADGTFAYPVAVENPTSQEDWREDAAVLIDGDERIVTTDHASIDLALSPDGEQVVVAKAEGPTDDEYSGPDPIGLFTYNVDGSGEERLTLESAGSRPDWSPDGERVAYISGRTIRTVDVDDKEEREIFRLPEGGNSYLVDVAWSGDSNEIAFFSGGHKDGTILWTMSAEGSEPRRVLRTSEVLDALAWSPVAEEFAWSGYYKGVRSVVIAGPDGRPRQVEPNSGNPVWSRDGSRLAYVISHEGHYESRIVIGDSEGKGERAIEVPEDARGATTLTDWASC